MKKDSIQLESSMVTLVIVLLFTFNASAQLPFQVKWSMDYTQAGASSHANFSPSNANLMGGANTYTLPTVYSAGGAVVVGYVTRPWPGAFSVGRCMDFTFSASSLKYDISSISFRLRRSGDGPKQILVRTSMDNFGSDLTAITIVNSGQFYSYNIPVSYNDLSNNTFSVRIYGFSPLSIYGTLWFDEIIVNGLIPAIILPIRLTYLNAKQTEKAATVSWETVWEKNSKEFVIERSIDLKEFRSIGTVPAAGETAGKTSYEYVDDAAVPGINYYRLKMIDRDGSYTFSEIVDVMNEYDARFLSVMPNPVSSEKITISGQNVDPKLLILSNAAGQRVTFRFEPIQGNLIHLYPVQSLKSGIYFLTYHKNGRKEHVKILVP